MAYMTACQPELQSVCAVIQQANELGLKARVCEVSPFLLLRGDNKFSVTPKDIDFSELKTIDALDLPGVVNGLCSQPVSSEYVQSYTEIRKARNKFVHLGNFAEEFTLDKLLHLLLFQYCELWNDRVWLRDRAEFAAKSRNAILHDGKYTSSEMEVMEDWQRLVALTTNSEFKRLFGREKTVRRYLCDVCFDNANTRYADLNVESCGTAYLAQDKTRVHCIMCGEDFAVSRKKCKKVGCKGTIISVGTSQYDLPRCLTCGEQQYNYEEWQKIAHS